MSRYELIEKDARKYDILVNIVRTALVNGRPKVPGRLLDDLLAVEAKTDEIARQGLRPLELIDATNWVKSEAYASIATLYSNYLRLLEISGR